MSLDLFLQTENSLQYKKFLHKKYICIVNKLK